MRICIGIIEMSCSKTFIYRWNETYTWSNVNCCVHNIIVGKLWIEQYGTMEIINHKTGTFHQSKMFPFSSRCLLVHAWSNTLGTSWSRPHMADVLTALPYTFIYFRPPLRTELQTSGMVLSRLAQNWRLYSGLQVIIILFLYSVLINTGTWRPFCFV